LFAAAQNVIRVTGVILTPATGSFFLCGSHPQSINHHLTFEKKFKMFHVWWPAVAAVALFVIVVVFLILRYGETVSARLCGTQPRRDFGGSSGAELEMMTYDHSVHVSEKEFAV
jgi:hypothetical protein